MNLPKDWLTSPWQAGSGWLRDMGKSHGAERRSPSLVPIRSLSPRHRDRIIKHLLKLDARDRYLRFGYAANDEQVRRYVEQLDFERDDIFGIFNRRLELISMAHLAFAGHPEHEKCAEFGVSVLKSARGKGLGARLFARAVLHARSKNVSMMFIHALSENSEAYLELPPADFETHVSELVTEHLGEMDYQLKKQAVNFWAFLAGVQEVRKGVQEGRHKSGE